LAAHTLNRSRTRDARRRRTASDSRLNLDSDGAINAAFAKHFAAALGADKLVFAIDARAARLPFAVGANYSLSPLDMVQALDPFCCAFLYTHIDTEGLMSGLPLEPVRELRRPQPSNHRAGGISTHQESTSCIGWSGCGCWDGAYLGRLTLPDTIPISK